MRKISETLTIASKILTDTDNTDSPIWYICVALSEAQRQKQITVTEYIEAAAYIQKQIGDYSTLISYLRNSTNEIGSLISAGCPSFWPIRDKWLATHIAELQSQGM